MTTRNHVRTHRIAAIPADGIGPEVIEYYRLNGRMMPADGLEQLGSQDAIFFGAVGAPDIPDHVTLWGLRLGSLGVAPTANIDPERRFPSMFEPIHGSAFDIAGKGIANPVATFWTASQMLEHLGETRAASVLIKAVEDVGAAGKVTPDVGGTATTREVTDAVIDAIRGANLIC